MATKDEVLDRINEELQGGPFDYDARKTKTQYKQIPFPDCSVEALEAYYKFIMNPRGGPNDYPLEILQEYGFLSPNWTYETKPVDDRHEYLRLEREGYNVRVDLS